MLLSSKERLASIAFSSNVHWNASECVQRPAKYWYILVSKFSARDWRCTAKKHRSDEQGTPRNSLKY